MGMIANDWQPAVQEEFGKPYYKELYRFVKEEYSTHVIYPPSEDIFNAMHLTPLSEVKVLILGQDPYHNEHQGAWPELFSTAGSEKYTAFSAKYLQRAGGRSGLLYSK